MAKSAVLSPSTTAWVLELNTRVYAAVGELEMVHIIQSPTLFEVPRAPFYCRHVLLWQDRIVPCLDPAAWLKGDAIEREYELIGICVYQQKPDAAVDYGALPLASIPVRAQVHDDQACALPEHSQGWRELAISCFADQTNRTIPILDLPYIFSGGLAKTTP